MIEARGLSRSFGGREVVREVTFTVAPGEVVGFLGPNGAGKTTTIRMLLGVLRPDGGSASVNRPMGYLPELFSPYDALLVRSYLEFMCRMKKVGLDHVRPAMRRAGIEDLEGRLAGRLSKGQRQRLGLAQALLGSPHSCILDEPTQGLDPKQVVEARAVIRSLAADGASVLLSTHLLAEAAAMCDRLIVMVKGRVVSEEESGPIEQLEQKFLRLVGESELR